jgi:hypothetical protein
MFHYCSLMPAREQKPSRPAVAVTKAPEPPEHRARGTGGFISEPEIPTLAPPTHIGVDWMPAAEALRLVCERNGVTLATRSIRKRAGSGLLLSWAKLSRCHGRGRYTDVADAELPPEFWLAGYTGGDWSAGDFEMLVGDRQGYRFQKWQAFGVMFDRAGIEAMLASAPIAEGQMQQAEDESNGGGRPHALDWEVAALEMAGRYYCGDLKPNSIADVIRAIQQWAKLPDGGPPDPTVRPHAKRIFEAFKAWEANL